jgi:hypothetical protein
MARHSFRVSWVRSVSPVASVPVLQSIIGSTQGFPED